VTLFKELGWGEETKGNFLVFNEENEVIKLLKPLQNFKK
jgi:hypothetical protein